MSNDASKMRLHVAMGEDFARAGGLHSYVRGLSEGQSALGLRPAIVHNVGRDGKFETLGLSLEELRSDSGIVHYHFAQSAQRILKAASSPWMNWPAVYHFHGPWFREAKVQGQSYLRQRAKYHVEKKVYRRFNAFVTASEAFAADLKRDFRVQEDRIRTVLPGVDTKRFTPASPTAARIALGLPVGVNLAVAVRRLEPRMGLDVAISAMRALPDWHLAIVGTGSLAASLLNTIEDAHLTHRVTLLGRVSDEALPMVYQAADVCLVPTTALEGFGMIVLESFGCGTPVIATTVGGLPEALGPFSSDWAIEPNSTDSLIDKLRNFSGTGTLKTAVRNYAQSRSFAGMASEIEEAAADLRPIAPLRWRP